MRAAEEYSAEIFPVAHRKISSRLLRTNDSVKIVVAYPVETPVEYRVMTRWKTRVEFLPGI